MQRIISFSLLLLAGLLIGSASAQTINPNQIRPGTNGNCLLTASGVSTWTNCPGSSGGVSLTTTGTSGPSTLSGSTLNIPQYQGALTLTTTGSSGPATLSGATLNIPQYSGGGSPGGSNHSVQFNSSSSFGGTAFNGLLKASTTADPSAAVAADVDALGNLTNSTSGNAATATALAGTPTLCSTGNAPTGILASGNATGCAPLGGVTSVGLSAPSYFSVTGSPVTGSGVLAISGATLAQNLVLATPNGTGGVLAPRALVGADLPLATGATFGAVKPDGTTITISGGVISAATGGAGTVSNVSSGNLSPLFTVSVANPTSTPAFTFTQSTAVANSVFGNFTGSAAAPTFSATPSFAVTNLTGTGGFAITGNAGSATKLATARTINGTSFDGTANITITAAPSGTAGGALAGTYPNPTIAGIGAQYNIPFSDGSGHLTTNGITTDSDDDLLLTASRPDRYGIEIQNNSAGPAAGSIIIVAADDSETGLQIYANSTVYSGSGPNSPAVSGVLSNGTADLYLGNEFTGTGPFSTTHFTNGGGDIATFNGHSSNSGWFFNGLTTGGITATVASTGELALATTAQKTITVNGTTCVLAGSCTVAASSTAFQVNGTPLTASTTVNYQSGTNITVTNPSAGNVAFNISGSVPTTFDLVGSGTNLGHGLVCGTGCVESTAGTGIINANEQNGVLYSGLATGLMKNTTSTGVPSIAVAGTDYVAPIESANFVFDGDSLTHGVSPADGSNAYPAQAALLPALAGHGTVTNVSVSGQTCEAAQTRYTANVHPLSPAVTGNPGYYFIMCGTNNVAVDGVATAYTALQGLWSSAKTDGFKVIAYTIPYKFDSSANSQLFDQYNNSIRGGSTLYDYFVDTPNFLPDPYNTAYFQADQEHPTTAGNSVLSRRANDAIAYLGSNGIAEPASHYVTLGSGASNVRGNMTALYGLTTGSSNTAMGEFAGIAITTGGNNSLYGQSAGGKITTGSNNTFFGYLAGGNEVTSSSSTFIGQQAGSAATAGSDVGVGTFALAADTTGNNVAIGNGALGNLTAGFNTAIGNNAGSAVVGGTNNVLIGFAAGNTITSGGNDVAIGQAATIGAAISNATAIGNGATASAANAVALGASALATASGAGQIGAGTNATANTLQFQSYNFLTAAGAATFASIKDTGLLSASSLATDSSGNIIAGSGSTPAYPQTVTGCVSGGLLYGSLSTQVTCAPLVTAGSVLASGGAATAPLAATGTQIITQSGILSAANTWTSTQVFPAIRATSLTTTSTTTALNFSVFAGSPFANSGAPFQFTGNLLEGTLSTNQQVADITGTWQSTGTYTGNISGLMLNNTFGVGSTSVYSGSQQLCQLCLTPTYNVANSSAIGYATLYAAPTVTLASTSATNYNILMPNFSVTAGGIETATHFVGGSSSPTIAAGAGAGTSPTVAMVSGATDLSGYFTVSTGTLPTLSATVATVTFNVAYGVAPKCFVWPANVVTQALVGVAAAQIFPSGITTSTFALTQGATALAASTAYEWGYTCTQ